MHTHSSYQPIPLLPLYDGALTRKSLLLACGHCSSLLALAQAYYDIIRLLESFVELGSNVVK